MGSYSYVYVGSEQFSWKNFYPDVAFLLFSSGDYRAEEGPADDEIDDFDGSEIIADPGDITGTSEKWYQHRFETTSASARRRLQEVGVDEQFLRDTHFAFFSFDPDEYRDSLRYHVASYTKHYMDTDEEGYFSYVERLTDRLLSRYFKALNSEEEFAHLVHHAAAKGSRSDYLASLRRQSLSSSEVGSVAEFSMREFERGYLRSFLAQDPYLRPFAEDFEPGSGSDDLNFIYNIGVLLARAEPDIPVLFELSEILTGDPHAHEEVEEWIGEERRRVFTRLGYAVTLLARVRNGAIVQATTPEYEPPAPMTARRKGDALEAFVADFFAQQAGFRVIRNVKRRTEEIDLVVINRVDDPFWTALQSPLILLECKNVARPVEASDLRNFEIKILERSGLCRLGLIVSSAGFTKGCVEAAARCGRDGYRILLISTAELERVVDQQKHPAEWLEDALIDQF